MTLVGTFLNTCKRLARKTAVIDQNGAVTYDDLRIEAISKATQLLSENMGSHIGILLPNCKEFVTTFYGILMAGKIPVPLNYLLSPAQLLYVIQNAGIDTVFTNSLFKPHLGNQIRHILSAEEKSSCTTAEENKITQGMEDDLAALLY
ncbi:MAG: acyl--CoA ligase, partial [Planctomycetes bacterium]|nr:acyl--CoA ligase [Planctomycetota bacterium]